VVARIITPPTNGSPPDLSLPVEAAPCLFEGPFRFEVTVWKFMIAPLKIMERWRQIKKDRQRWLKRYAILSG